MVSAPLPRPLALLLALLVLLPGMARAGSSLLIWPIDPALEHGQRASALWLENHGSQPALLQVRIFAWSQRDGEEHYQAQHEVVGSPPMFRVEPGARQLVRLTRLAPSAPGTERAYRILIDEVPTPQASPTSAEGNGIRFQMRYSVPLFLYGEGLGAKGGERPALEWRQLVEGGKAYLEVRNRGPRHARLTQVVLERPSGSQAIEDGLLGYVLAGASMRWPLPRPLSGGGRLRAEVNGEGGEIAAALR